MGGIGLFPSKSVVIGKSSQNVTIKKQIILFANKWVETNNLYCYTIKDEDVTLDTIVFMRSYKEYINTITSCGIMVSYPEISKGEIKVYATSIPSESITCDYILCNESTAIVAEDASQLAYHDSHHMGVSNVQEALDLLLSQLNN